MGKAIASALISLIVYVWISAFIWHQLPTIKGEVQWWEIPALVTTVLGGFGVYFIAFVVHEWRNHERNGK